MKVVLAVERLDVLQFALTLKLVSCTTYLGNRTEVCSMLSTCNTYLPYCKTVPFTVQSTYYLIRYPTNLLRLRSQRKQTWPGAHESCTRVTDLTVSGCCAAAQKQQENQNLICKLYSNFQASLKHFEVPLMETFQNYLAFESKVLQLV
jgi:hypothetical protein